jgi:hypothetical protein
VYSPTAAQNVVEGHDAAFSTLLVAPGGAAAGWTFQELPFQTSASACGTFACEDCWKEPPASHATALPQDTALTVVRYAPAWPGTDCTLQALPSHTAAQLKEAAELSV